MAYGRIYIDNLRKKVIPLFERMQKTSLLNSKEFIRLFRQFYPKDYEMLEYEYEYKLHEFKKNRKGQPKPQPLKPEKILLNMYQNWYFKLIKASIVQEQKKIAVNKMRCNVGTKGLRIKPTSNNRYTIIDKNTKEILHDGLTFLELRENLYPDEEKNAPHIKRKLNQKGRKR